MSYALYSGRKWLGSLATISGYGDLIEAVEAFNRGPQKGKVAALTHLVESGASNDPQQVARDIATLLAEETPLREDVVETFQNLKRLLRGVKRSIRVGES